MLIFETKLFRVFFQFSPNKRVFLTGELASVVTCYQFCNIMFDRGDHILVQKMSKQFGKPQIGPDLCNWRQEQKVKRVILLTGKSQEVPLSSLR